MAENTLDGYLEKAVSDWADDDFARARFKAFTGQKEDWEEKLSFWKDLIIKVARHLDLIVVDTNLVQQKWFIRDGVVPMGLQHVLVEMKKSGELETVEQVLGVRLSRLEWVGSVLKKAIFWAAGSVLSSSQSETEMAIEERLVVVPVLQERVSRFLKVLAQNHFSSIYIATLAKIKELCGGSEEAELVIGYLLVQGKAQFMTLTGSEQIEGFKISLNEKCVPVVSENDYHILQLHWTLEMLQLRLNTLDSRISMSRNLVSVSLKTRAKREALRYVRSMKLLQLSREQCANSMFKIEQVLSIIADAEASKKVAEAIQVSSAAIKANHVSLEEVQHTLTELDEAITLQRETEEAIAGVTLSTGETNDDADLDEELALLEEEMETENLSLPEIPIVPVVLNESQKPPPLEESESDRQTAPVELEKCFANLAL